MSNEKVHQSRRRETILLILSFFCMSRGRERGKEKEKEKEEHDEREKEKKE